ncbi:hypothetical protein I4U23_017773 [Adineta vaga]|nr:hypothetical protein I4U23_017773 [Adineta vaga]
MNNILLYFALLFVCVGTANSINCYFCSNCPNPFYPSSPAVSVVQSYSGYCAKKSLYSDYRYPSTRGLAQPGLCSWSGCRWTNEPTTGQRIYLCCCRSSYCNTGSITSKSTMVVLVSALMLSLINRFV